MKKDSRLLASLIRVFGVLLLLTALAIPLVRAPDRAVETLVARWAPPPSDFIDLKGQLVHVRDVGPRNDPLPIVLVHGTSASLHCWEGWAKALRGQHRVISFDLPGFGLTGPHAGAYAQQAYTATTDARFTLDLLDAMQLKRFVIGGNSLGGEVAWRVALLAPERVAKLVLVDAGGYAFDPPTVPLGWRLARVPAFSWLLEELLPRPLIVSGLIDVYGDPQRITDAQVDRYFELTLRAGNRRALAERIQQWRRGADESLIAGIKTPTLIMWGGRDRVIPPAFAQRFAHDIAGSKLVMFDTLGHVPHEEDPAATVAPVIAFLSRP
ncbi:MAG: alpha/beta hydrolase [Burkholderiales bacterium]|nr:alpha/beta hydrolase [Burkholderiales bacterium]